MCSKAWGGEPAPFPSPLVEYSRKDPQLPGTGRPLTHLFNFGLFGLRVFLSFFSEFLQLLRCELQRKQRVSARIQQRRARDRGEQSPQLPPPPQQHRPRLPRASGRGREPGRRNAPRSGASLTTPAD